MIYRPAESLYSTPETDTTLYVNYTEMQFFYLKKNKSGQRHIMQIDIQRNQENQGCYQIIIQGKKF